MGGRRRGRNDAQSGMPTSVTRFTVGCAPSGPILPVPGSYTRGFERFLTFLIIPDLVRKGENLPFGLFPV